MELLIGLLAGTIIGFILGKKFVEEQAKEANRARWRRYADAKRARKAASRGN